MNTGDPATLIVMGPVVVDAEEISRNLPESKGTIEMLCIYEIGNTRIEKASFALGRKTICACESRSA